MTAKRKPSLKRIFVAWLNFKKKSNEASRAERVVSDLAHAAEPYVTELIEHEGIIYRVSTDSNRYGIGYQITRVCESSELPTQNKS
jgi:hypothetical protein